MGLYTLNDEESGRGDNDDEIGRHLLGFVRRFGRDTEGEMEKAALCIFFPFLLWPLLTFFLCSIKITFPRKSVIWFIRR